MYEFQRNWSSAAEISKGALAGLRYQRQWQDGWGKGNEGTGFVDDLLSRSLLSRRSCLLRGVFAVLRRDVRFRLLPSQRVLRRSHNLRVFESNNSAQNHPISICSGNKTRRHEFDPLFRQVVSSQRDVDLSPHIQTRLQSINRPQQPKRRQG